MIDVSCVVTGHELGLFVVQLKTPLVSDDVTVLTPGSMAPSVPSTDSGKTRKRRRRLSVDVSNTFFSAITVDLMTGMLLDV